MVLNKNTKKKNFSREESQQLIENKYSQAQFAHGQLPAENLQKQFNTKSINKFR